MIDPEVYTPYATAPRVVADRRPRPTLEPVAAPVDGTLAGWIAGLSDARLVGLTASVLFVLSAWPLLLVDLPPFQDLPNHVATAHIIEHPELFPQFVFNGFFKSNCLLTLWFHLFGDHRLLLAARLFTAVAIGVNALALPLFFRHFGGRRAMVTAMLFAWPLVHGFFVSMGFLNYVVAFGLSLILLIVLDGQRLRPTWRRGLGIAALSGVIWYAHLFPLVVIGALAAWDALKRPGWGARLRAGAAMLLPLVPAGLLSLMAAQHHLVKAERLPAGFYPLFSYQTLWDMVAHLWRDASGALTRWGSMSLVPALLLPLFAWRGRHTQRRFFTNGAMAGLAAAYVALPVMMSNWCYLNCRLVPFIWVGLALCVPATLPRRLPAVLVACAVSFSLVLGIDYVRVARDSAEMSAGLDAVPRGATVMPLLFKRKKTAEFVASLAHAWGPYTTERDAMVPLVFAVERSYPITWAKFPPRKTIPPTFDQFAERYATPAQVCQALGQPAVDEFCTAAWRQVWQGFWKEVEPRFSHLLTWAIPDEARPLIPPAYHRTFAAGDLEIYARESNPRGP